MGGRALAVDTCIDTWIAVAIGVLAHAGGHRDLSL